MISSIKELKIVTLATFAVGCVIGLLSFSRVLKWLFVKYKNLTIATLTGFLLGSLNKLWPWKQNGQLLYTHSDGREEYLQSNVMPGGYDGDPLMMQAIGFLVLGFALIFIMEIAAKNLQKKQVSTND